MIETFSQLQTWFLRQLWNKTQPWPWQTKQNVTDHNQAERSYFFYFNFFLCSFHILIPILVGINQRWDATNQCDFSLIEALIKVDRCLFTLTYRPTICLNLVKISRKVPFFGLKELEKKTFVPHKSQHIIHPSFGWMSQLALLIVHGYAARHLQIFSLCIYLSILMPTFFNKNSQNHCVTVN